MATTVFANGNAVATSTSDHVAHITAPDFRYPPGTSPAQAQGLWNEIDSTHIARAFPTKTEFGGGKIWTSPVEVGDPPKSMPMDGFLGVKNGGLINSYSCAAPGEGSKNVFVEANKVLRFLDATEQNAKNSPGIINDQAGADAARKAFKPVIPETPEQIAAKAKSKSQGGAAGKDGKGDQSGQVAVAPPVTPPTAEQCTEWGVEMKEGARPQSDPDVKKPDAYIEVVGRDATISLRAMILKNCGKHADWTGPGWSATGETAEFRVPAVTNQPATLKGPILGAIGTFTRVMSFADERPDEYRLTSSGCEKANFNRLVRRFSLELPTAPQIQFGEQDLKKPAGGSGGEVQYGITLLLNRFFAVGNSKTFKFLTGSIGVAYGWEEHPSAYYAYAKIVPSGTLTLIQWENEWRFPFENWTIPHPAVKAVQLAIEGINEVSLFLFDRRLISLYFFLRINLKVDTTLGGAIRKRYQGRWEWGGLTWSATGAFQGAVGISLDALAANPSMNRPVDQTPVFRARGEAQINLSVTGRKTAHEPPQLGVQVSLKPLTLVLTVSWDLTVLLPAANTNEKRSWWQRASDRLRRSIGENLLKGGIEKSVDLFEERKFPEDPGWLFPWPLP